MEIKIAKQARGTRIILGNEAQARRGLLNQLITLAEISGFEEILLPSIEPADIYVKKAGKKILNQMYVFQDKKGRQLCLRPEATATIQLVVNHLQGKEKRLWYFEKCWRYERPQAGRYREFYQFGVEIVNPKDKNAKELLIDMATGMVGLKTNKFNVDVSVRRGLDYYVEDGFEINCPQLGAQQQVCGGGAYEVGIGFALGFDRLMLCEFE